RERLPAQVDELRGGDGEGLLQERVAQRRPRPLGQRRAEQPLAHRGTSPARTWARCTAFTDEPRRDSPPPICMRQPASHATRHRAPVASTLASFLSRIALDTSGRRTAKEPP